MMQPRRKSLKFYLSPKKARATEDQVWTVIYNDKEASDETEMNNHIDSSFNYLHHLLMLI